MRKTNKIAVIVLFFAIIFGTEIASIPDSPAAPIAIEAEPAETEVDETEAEESAEEPAEESAEESAETASPEQPWPVWNGQPYAVLNNNVPEFDDLNITEHYDDLDSLGRCGTCYALLGKETMPTEPRGKIGMVKPSGWHTVKYDNIDGRYLYNRCHLIGYQLSGENANEKNLITGTRYLNVEGMLPFENEVADYIRTGRHVLYRVTPVFIGNDLVATGVKMEAKSIEDDEIQFNVFCFNVQPGIKINYATGESEAEE